MPYVSDIYAYVMQKLNDGAITQRYIKTVKIQARKGILGEEIVTKMSNGHIETKSVVKTEGDMIITNPSGEQYRISAEMFEKRYTPDTEKAGWYFSKPVPQTMMFIDEDISFKAHWGEDMHIKAGGVLNITDMERGEIYGIQLPEFKETYVLHKED